jgi:pSer/pThr/pTyr-binding forkhead associated (FHA) protein
MNVRLVMEKKRQRVWATEIRGTEATLGRARGSTVRIPSSQVSRLHCRLYLENGVVTVEDLESVNGTFLNGVRVRDIQMVLPGDRLTVGPATFVVEYELPPAVLDRARAAVEVVPAEDEIEIIDEPPSLHYSAPPPRRRPAPVAEEPLEVEPVEEEPIEFIISEEDEILPEFDIDEDELMEDR